MAELRFPGVLAAVTTPFRADGSVDRDRFGQHCAWLISEGVRGVIPNGSLGEYEALTGAERAAAVEIAVEAVGASGSVVPGVSGKSAAEAVRWTEQARGAGAAAVARADRRRGRRALHRRGRGRVAGDRLQQSVLDAGRPHRPAARTPRAGRGNRRRQGVLAGRAPRGADPGVGAVAGGSGRLRRSGRRGRADGRDRLDCRVRERVPRAVRTAVRSVHAACLGRGAAAVSRPAACAALGRGPDLRPGDQARPGRGRSLRRPGTPAPPATGRADRGHGAQGRDRSPRGCQPMRSRLMFNAVDSHTEGMPTRVITSGVGTLPGATMADRRLYMMNERDDLRTLLMTEPRGRSVTFQNVPAYLHLRDAQVQVDGLGAVTLDVAWGGNYYAILPAGSVGIDVRPDQHDELIRVGLRIIDAVNEQLEFAHPEQPEIAECKHVILTSVDRDARSAVVIHPGWIDRSPCGTGTSARMATLATRGELGLDTDFEHRSLIGSMFTGRLLEETTVGAYRAFVPTITGRAWITGLASYLLDPDDPFPAGFRMGQ